MCKEEYLILLILLNWRRLLAQIVKIGSGRDQECFYRFDDGGYSTRGVRHMWATPGERVWEKGRGPPTNELEYLRLKETQTAISSQTPTLIWIMVFPFSLFFFSSISVSFALCVAFGV